MTIQQRNTVPNSLSLDESPNAAVMNIVYDAQLMGQHYFGELVVVPKVGHKVKIGETRNELAHIVMMGNLLTGGWIVKRRRPNTRLVERRNPQSITDFTDDEIKVETGGQWLPERRQDGVVIIKSRAPIIDENSEQSFIALGGDDWEGELYVDQFLTSLPKL